MPLPAGSWTVVAHLPITSPEGDRLDSAIVARIERSAVVGMMLLISSDPRKPTIKDRRDAVGCDRNDFYLSRGFVSPDGSTEECMRVTCSLPHNWKSSPRLVPVFRAAYAELERRHVAIPEVLVQAGFDLWARSQMLTTIYYFNPAAEGIALGSPSGWDKYEVEKSARRAAYVARVKSWGAHWWPAMRASFAGSLKAAGPAPGGVKAWP